MSKTYQEGKTIWIFNNDAFNGLFISTVNRKRMNGSKYTKENLFNELAVSLNVSIDTVKKWRQSTGPADLNLVKEIADFFNTDYQRLLLSPNQEEAMIKGDKLLIKDIFEKAIEVIYLYVEKLVHIPRDCAKEERESFALKMQKELTPTIELLHCSIDKAALETTDTTRYKLHRIVIELNAFVDKENFPGCEALPSRWCDNEWLENEGLFNRFIELTRNDALKDEYFNWYYLIYEREYADKFNYVSPAAQKAMIDLPEGCFVEEGDSIDFPYFGVYDIANGSLGIENTPQLIFCDLMTQVIKEVFYKEFPQFSL